MAFRSRKVFRTFEKRAPGTSNQESRLDKKYSLDLLRVKSLGMTESPKCEDKNNSMWRSCSACLCSE